MIITKNNEPKNFNYKFQIKLHPTYTKKRFLIEVPEASDSRFKFVEDSLYDLFPDTALLVSSDSSACFEAIYCGGQLEVSFFLDYQRPPQPFLKP